MEPEVPLARQVTVGLYDFHTHEKGWHLAFVVALGQTQCLYITIDYPMAMIKKNKEDFLRDAGDKYAFTTGEVAQRFLKTRPATMGYIEPKALEILRDLAGLLE